MAVAQAVKSEVVKPRPGIELPSPQRFRAADLTRQGAWLLKRLMKALPNRDERSIATWLSGAMYSDEFLFLTQENSVALAQVMSANGLEDKPIVRERFVFAKEGYVEEASYFYKEFERWAKSMGAEVMIVEQNSDVPHDTIKEVLGGRLFTRQEVFARVG